MNNLLLVRILNINESLEIKYIKRAVRKTIIIVFINPKSWGKKVETIVQISKYY